MIFWSLPINVINRTSEYGVIRVIPVRHTVTTVIAVTTKSTSICGFRDRRTKKLNILFTDYIYIYKNVLHHSNHHKFEMSESSKRIGSQIWPCSFPWPDQLSGIILMWRHHFLVDGIVSDPISKTQNVAVDFRTIVSNSWV